MSDSKLSHPIDDRDAVFEFCVFVWSHHMQMWEFLTAGRTREEIESRVQYWIGKGVNQSDIRIYATIPSDDILRDGHQPT